MNKILVVILVTVVVVYLMRRMAQSRGDKPLPPPGGKKTKVEDMVRCRVCGVNLPRSEAILARGRFYCCDEHRKSDL